MKTYIKSKRTIIAIDGTAGSGKSTLAKSLAKSLGYRYVDTGAMYRYVTYIAQRKGIKSGREIAAAAGRIKRFVNNSRLRHPAVSGMVSRVAAIKKVRNILVKRQRDMGKDGGIVMEGRDIGTAVFPNAGIKIFLTADIKERARRRHKELAKKGIPAGKQDVERGIKNRDIKDSGRSVSPLAPADDAVIIDTTGLSIKKKNRIALKYIKERLGI